LAATTLPEKAKQINYDFIFLLFFLIEGREPGVSLKGNIRESKP